MAESANGGEILKSTILITGMNLILVKHQKTTRNTEIFILLHCTRRFIPQELVYQVKRYLILEREQVFSLKEISFNNGLDINFQACSAEEISFPNGYFDSITAVQCFLYFNKEIILPKIYNLLITNGLFATVWMAWIPEQSEIARKTEELILKHNPASQGCGYKPAKSEIPEWSLKYFKIKTIENYLENIPFTIDSWLGRIRACRGVAASLNEQQVRNFNEEHNELLLTHNKNVLSIPHQILIHVFEKI